MDSVPEKSKQVLHEHNKQYGSEYNLGKKAIRDKSFGNYNLGTNKWNDITDPVLTSGKSVSVPWQETQPTLATFTRFAELARELRDMIWEAALPDPRVLRLYSSEVDSQMCVHLSTGSTLPNGFGFQHLLTCKESAEVFKRKYSHFQLKWRIKSDTRRVEQENERHGSEGEIRKEVSETILTLPAFFDFKRDTLLFYSYSLRMINQRYSLLYQGAYLDLSKVQNVALYSSSSLDIAQEEGSIKYWDYTRKHFPKLKSLSLAFGVYPEPATGTPIRLADIDKSLEQKEPWLWNKKSGAERKGMFRLVKAHEAEFDRNCVQKDPAFWRSVDFRTCLESCDRPS